MMQERQEENKKEETAAEKITAYFLTILEIAEKELALLKLHTAKTVKGLGWFLMALILLVAGLLLLAWTCFTAVSLLIGPVAAGLTASVVAIAGGVVFLWISRKNLK
ncbi:MAG: hypothetical protein FWH49_01165 [Clostridiales bacterium]|nr:hypothetical protein [Clostridiales bacterium]